MQQTSYALRADEIATGRSTEDDSTESEDRLQAWRTHAGLYDGSGYGGETESTISHPSTCTRETLETVPTSEGTALMADAKGKDGLMFAGVQKDNTVPPHGSSDDETLEEVIRAYAVYEKEEEETNGSEWDIAEDLELANKIGG